jgi:hypothetical protein
MAPEPLVVPRAPDLERGPEPRTDADPAPGTAAGVRVRAAGSRPPETITEVATRRRALARALHERPRSPRIQAQLDELRRELARYRIAAIVLHARLVALEARNPAAGGLRATLIDSSVRLVGAVAAIVDPVAR